MKSPATLITTGVCVQPLVVILVMFLDTVVIVYEQFRTIGIAFVFGYGIDAWNIYGYGLPIN